MPGWRVSPRCWNSHITVPQDSAAKSENARLSGGMGLTADNELVFGAG